MVGQMTNWILRNGYVVCALLVALGIAAWLGKRITTTERDTDQRPEQRIVLGTTRSKVEEQFGQPSNVVGARYYYRTHDLLRPGESPGHPRYFIISYAGDAVTSVVLRAMPVGPGSDEDDFWGGSRSAWITGVTERGRQSSN